MKLKIPYSFLLVTAFFLNRLTVSAQQISAGESLRPFLIIFLSLGILFLLTLSHVKDWHRANYLTSLVVLFLLAHQMLYGWIKHEFTTRTDVLGMLLLLPLGLLFMVLASKRLWQSIPEPAFLTKYATLSLVILLGMQVGQLAVEYPNLRDSTRTAVSHLPLEIRLDEKNRPDIYLIVLDGYGRQDVLHEIYGYDNSVFLEELELRGFYVARNSHSNYIQTAYAIASLLNFDYLQPWQGSPDYYEYMVRPIQENRAFLMLKELGYTTIGFDSVTSYTEIRSVDRFYSDFLPLNEFETFLLTDSLVELLSNLLNLGFSIPNHEDLRQKSLDNLDLLAKIPGSVPSPKITFFHMLPPHPPFIFDAEGNPREPDRPYSFSDANEYGGTHEEYRDGYRQQISFVNKRILNVIDSILDESGTPPVIVLMSDHGPGSMFKWDPDDPGCLWERTGNLYALHLPGLPHDIGLQPDMTPVNTFRILFNTYFAAELPLLDDRSYFATWHYPNLILDLTESRDSRDSCAF